MSIGTVRTVNPLVSARTYFRERNAIWGLIAISAVHLALFSVQALDYGYVSAWLAGDLWGPQVWEVALSQSQAAFWQLVGSYVIPLLVLSALLLGLLRAEVPIPGFVGYALFAWILVCSAILEPSGFPLGLIPAGMLILAHRRRVHAAEQLKDISRTKSAQIAA